MTNTLLIAAGNSAPQTDADFALHPILPDSWTPALKNHLNTYPVSGSFSLGINGEFTKFDFDQRDIQSIEVSPGFDGPVPTTGEAQCTAFLKAVKNAMFSYSWDVQDTHNSDNNKNTLAQLGIAVSPGPAFNFTDEAGAARSIKSVMLTGPTEMTLSPGDVALVGSSNANKVKSQSISGPAVVVPIVVPPVVAPPVVPPVAIPPTVVPPVVVPPVTVPVPPLVISAGETKSIPCNEGLVVISGSIEQNNFRDVVLWQAWGGTVVLASVVYGTPPTRNYPNGQPQLQCSLVGGSPGEYGVTWENMGGVK